MIGKLLKRLFTGAANAPEPFETLDYGGYRIRPAPIREGELWRVAAEISREIDGATRTHRLVRADTLPDRQAAADAAVAKARLVVDQQGDRMFG